MEKLLSYLSTVTDNRQERKIRHKMSDIIALVLFVMLANANEWTTIEVFDKEHEGFLRRYLELLNGIPSHDTIQRVFSVVSPEYMQMVHTKWNEMLNSNEGKKDQKNPFCQW